MDFMEYWKLFVAEYWKSIKNLGDFISCHQLINYVSKASFIVPSAN